MRMTHLLAAVAMLPLVAACDGATPTTPAQQAAAAAPSPAGTRFDGRYVGPNNLTVSRGSACGAQSFNYVITVQNGNASVLFDRARNLGAAGPVQADGSFSMQPTNRASDMIFTGRIAGGRMTGEARGQQCSRTFELRRVGNAA